MVAALALCQLLTALCLALPNKPPEFLGFRIGMPARVALSVAGKNSHALDRVPPHDGQRVVSDTVPVTSCMLAMRRTLGFDSAGKLTAVGFTYKATPDKIYTAQGCVYQWLSKLYGPPTGKAMRDTTQQDVWKLGSSLQVTLEVRGYNPHDYFVLIYYYKGPLGAAKKEE